MIDLACLNALALALLAAAAMAFTRQRRLVMVCCGALFVFVATWETVVVWWGASPVATVGLLALLMGLPLLALLLFIVDYVWAPFCLEMTWPAMLCWVLWPVLVAADAAGLVAGFWWG